MRRWHNWVLLVASSALCLLVGEVLVRVLAGDTVELFPRYHTEAVYGDFTIRRLRPETTFWHTSVDGSWRFDVNKQGFRDDRDFSYEKGNGVLRILVLGDSHTQGFEVRQDQTYAAIAERYLDARGLDAEVINAGVSGFGTAEAAVFLEQEALKYDPDVVVLGFFANDMEDNVKSGLFRLKDGELVVQKTSHIPGVKILNIHNAVPPLRWLSENSYLYSLLLNTVWEAAKSALYSGEKAELATELAVATRDAGDYEKRLTTSLINRMYRLCESNSMTFIVLDIPQMAEPTNFKSSIPSDLLGSFERSSHALITSEAVLSPYRQVAEFHVPHGHRHMSALSHMLLGVEVARTVQRLYRPDGGDGGVAAVPSGKAGGPVPAGG